MLFNFKPIHPVSLTKLILTLIWLMDYNISKCDNVVLVVIKEIGPSKKHLFLSSKSENLLEKITRVNITKNNY